MAIRTEPATLWYTVLAQGKQIVHPPLPTGPPMSVDDARGRPHRVRTDELDHFVTGRRSTGVGQRLRGLIVEHDWLERDIEVMGILADEADEPPDAGYQQAREEKARRLAELHDELTDHLRDGLARLAALSRREHLPPPLRPGSERYVYRELVARIPGDPFPLAACECCARLISTVTGGRPRRRCDDCPEPSRIALAPALEGGCDEYVHLTDRRLEVQSVCAACGESFLWSGRRPSYCSPACRQRAQRQRNAA